MPKIIKDGITYGAAPSSEVWEGTQAQYDALTTKDPDVTYFITDSDPAPATNAAVISYDNTDSGLYAVNVQSAIDEVNTDFVDNVCKGRTAVRLTEITSSSVISITRTTTVQTYLVVVRGSNADSFYIGLISGYNGGSSRNAIADLAKGNNIGTVSFLTSDASDFTLSISIASSSISASLTILVLPLQNDDTFTITKA